MIVIYRQCSDGTTHVRSLVWLAGLPVHSDAHRPEPYRCRINPDGPSEDAIFIFMHLKPRLRVKYGASSSA